MVLPGTAPAGGISLRLLWPQWQGAGISSVAELAAEFPLDVARRGYAVGSAVLQAVLSAHDAPVLGSAISASSNPVTNPIGTVDPSGDDPAAYSLVAEPLNPNGKRVHDLAMEQVSLDHRLSRARFGQ